MVKQPDIKILEERSIEAAIVRLRSDGLLHLEFRQLEELTPAHVLEIFNTVEMIGGGKKYPTLITVKKYMQIGEETRRIWADENKNKFSSAEAMILYNMAVKLIGNFFIQYHQPPRPTRMFNSEEKGIEWLYSFLK